MTRLLVLGNATVDIVQRVARLPVIGETVLGKATLRCAGGKGLNQAIVAARAGATVDLVAPIGGDAEADLLRGMVAAEPLARMGWIVVDAPTDSSSIWVDTDGQNMIVSSAACVHALDAHRVEAEIKTRLGAGDWLLLQGNLSRAATAAAVAGARARGARVTINAAPICFPYDDILPGCDLLVVNEVEAMTLSGMTEPVAGARQLARGRDVVLTLGARGAIAWQAESEILVPAPQVAAVDSAGAGDVLVGTLVAELAHGAPMAAALALAVAAASLSVTRPGTSTAFPTMPELAVLRARAGVARTPPQAGLARS